MINPKKKKVGIVVQARMSSSRLPGKVLMKLDKNEKVLEILVKRLKLSNLSDELIIATTPDKKNSLIVDLAKEYNVQYFIGSEKNVLERYYLAAKQFKLDIILRITSDCPFIDPKIIDDMITFYKNNEYEYINNFDESTNFPVGYSIEIFSFKTLESVFFLASTEAEREHVTYYIKTHRDQFSTFSYNLEDLKKFKDLRLTVDYKEDLDMLQEVYKRLKKKGKAINFSLHDIIEIIEENPELMDINKHLLPRKDYFPKK